METQLGRFVRKARLEKGINLGKMAALVGYRNINKGIRNLDAFERSGITRADLFRKVVDALGLDHAEATRLFDIDEKARMEAYEAWASEPVPMGLMVRWMAGVYVYREIPESISTHEGAIAYASKVAREKKKDVMLWLSRREAVWFDRDGKEAWRRTGTYKEPLMQPGFCIMGRTIGFNQGKEEVEKAEPPGAEVVKLDA